MKKVNFKIFVFIFFLLLYNCIEQIPLETKTEFNEVLVIEATLTNEFKFQTIKLSKSYSLESTGPSYVSNALVTVSDELGNLYSFSETGSGVYTSIIAFAAQPNTKYQLEVIESGITYTSTQESFINPTQIEALYLERDFNENNEEGISIFIDTVDPLGSSKYYRFEYEETYKIIAPKYSALKLSVLNDDFPINPSQFGSIQEIQEYLVDLSVRDQQVQICYNTVNSNTIITADTNNFVEDRLEKYRVRFISRDNYIMSHRYSILVKQYVQSPEAHNFYNILKSFSLSESIFSENQLGFLEGNLSANQDTANKKVVGYFEVNPADTRRIYFNYADEFPGEDLPPYYTYCEGKRYPLLYRTDPITGEITESEVQYLITQGFKYFSPNPGDNPMFTGPLHPFLMVIEPCGDCTALGSTDIPDFWEE